MTTEDTQHYTNISNHGTYKAALGLCTACIFVAVVIAYFL